MKPESLGVSLTKLILAASIIVSLGAILGAAGYLAKNKLIVNQKTQNLSQRNNPGWIKQLIKKEENGEVANPLVFLFAVSRIKSKKLRANDFGKYVKIVFTFLCKYAKIVNINYKNRKYVSFAPDFF